MQHDTLASQLHPGEGSHGRRRDGLPAHVHRPGATGALRLALGVLRVAGVLGLLLVACPVLLAAVLVPVRVRGARAAQWAGTGVCRAFLWTAGVRVRVDRPEVLRAHRGFVFFNHLTFLDALLVLAVRPTRFLAARGVGRIPFVGPMARALGTLFVDRGTEASRAAARRALRAAVASSATPVALAPEGRIGPGPGVLPLRHGAFEVAAEAGAPVLLVALRFEPLAAAAWHEGEWLLRPLWRLCARTGAFTARVTPLGPALDPEAAPPEALAAEAARRFDAELLGGGGPAARAA